MTYPRSYRLKVYFHCNQALRLLLAIASAKGAAFGDLIRVGNKEIQVFPVGDKCVNRKPDLIVMQPEHLVEARQAIK